MWAVFAFCDILSTYNLVMAIIGCCACCSMDQLEEAPATTAGANPTPTMAVPVSKRPVL
jgi:hypothetical protein